MLTESEREWLERREFIQQCEGDYIWAGYWEEGVELKVMQEAAEFEARVAAKLAIHHLCITCPYPDGPGPRPCGWCLMKRARLKVEEEMDADRT